MNPIVLIFLVNLLLNTVINSQTIQRSEVLGRPTNNSITVQLIFLDSAEIRVQYSTSSGIYTDQTTWQTFAGNVPAEIIISGLTETTKYYYRINYRRPNASGFSSRPEYTFHTQRKPGSSFSFVVQADPHLDIQSDTALYKICLQNQLDDSPDFMIDLGDFLMTDKLKNSSNIIPFDTISYRCNLLRSYYEKSCHSVPLFIALGNHEGEAGWNLNGTPNNIAIWGTKERQKYFLNPYPNHFYTGDTIQHNFVGLRENYYAWQWGDALFIVLDPYWYTSPKPDSLSGWNWTLGQTQYNWLKKTLENSKATFKFVFSHQIIGGNPEGRGGVEYANFYEWGGDNLDGTPGFALKRPGWDKPIKDLFTEHRVNIFFHGHDHMFGKQEKDCLIYQVTPQPSHPNFSNVNYAAKYGYVSGQILPQSGHLRVTVDSSGIQVDYVRVYLPINETSTRHNKDVSATYFIGSINCYDSLSTGVPIIWNSNYSDEIVYPNPFSKETKIEFSLNKSERIDLSIYNENGQLVRKLIAGSLIQSGKYQVIWDGNNFAGIEQGNGIYWYHITGESKGTASGKIILIH
ncbi:MAG: metallophosphoesterase [Saprospiraceae bacterium]